MRRLTVLLLAVTSVLLLGRGAVPCGVLDDQPGCLVTFLPGPTRDTFGLVEITGATTSESDGELLLTTVLVDTTLSLREWIESKFDTTIDTYDRDLFFPEGVTEEEVDERNAQLMRASQIEATLAGLRAAGYDVSLEPTGLSVAGFADDHRIAEGDLEVGDVLVSVDGEPVATFEDILAALSGRQPGDVVTLTRRRGDEEAAIEVELVDSPDEPGRPLIGILLGEDYDLPVDVQIEAGEIGGPSAGLMFALSIVDTLRSEDLTGGRVIAGTGTITPAGDVGSIGGIRQKIVGALNRADDLPPATVFLVPAANLAEARTAPVDKPILLVPVATIGEALAALELLRVDEMPANAVQIGN
ncbi:MAG: PDZ domain-containing protein [Nitriliruptorales bacterium]|nr:PDZ domain-containing protein [Nitriliruptorales bacterium]